MNEKRGIRFLKIMVAVVMFCLYIMAEGANGSVPERINYQGYLTDKNGNPINAGVTITVSIYTVPTGGTPLWTEQHIVVPDSGVYNLVLGSMEPLYLDYSLHDLFYLGVKVGSDAEMTPRQEVTSVGSAHTAWTALNLVCTSCVSQTDIDQTSVQRRVSGTCAAGSSIRVISQDGTVTCETDDTGGIPSNTVTTLDGSSAPGTASEYSRGDHKHAIGTGAITSSHILDGTIMNTDINAAAGISGTKLASDGSVMKSLSAGTNISVNNNNNGSWTVTATGGNNWSLTGNSSTNPTNNFIGTTDNQALVLRVNNAQALLIEPTTTSPNIIGGYSSVISGVYGATIAGGGKINGFENSITDDFGTIGGGLYNRAGNSAGTTSDATFGTVAGGYNNRAEGTSSSVGGGVGNRVTGLSSSIAGGESNYVSGQFSSVGGGIRNQVTADYGTIAGGGWAVSGDVGTENRVTDNYGTIGGGGNNQAGNNVGTTSDATYATVGGGVDNDASGPTATVGGGGENTASGSNATVGGGRENIASGLDATVGGGGVNYATGNYATVGGGSSNQASGDAAIIGGGNSNKATAFYAMVGGGSSNQANQWAATVCGGAGNIASEWYATVGGGQSNTVSATCATICGGNGNHAENEDAVVGGGFQNSAGGPRSTVGGGYQNQASNNAATVPGGANNIASGGYSFAAGAAASATHTGSFVWSSAEETSSFGDNTFTARAHGGVRFYTASGISTGCFIAPGGSDCAGASDRNLKDNFADVDNKEILETLMTLPIQTWNYKSQFPTIRHIGPVAQDFNSMFAYVFNEVESPVHVNKMDEIGISLSAIQGLYQLLKEKDVQIKELQAQVATLGYRLSTIEALITGGR
jgi:trimeric autotransporter adhesin